MLAPAIANHEQNVWRLQCHTYSLMPASSRHGWNHERVSNLPLVPSRGKTGSEGCCLGRLRDSRAAIASEFRWTARAEPFFVFVSSIVLRSKCTWDQVQEYCSLSRIPVWTLTTNSAMCSGKRLEMTLYRRSYSSRLRKRRRPVPSLRWRTRRAGLTETLPFRTPSR